MQSFVAHAHDHYVIGRVRRGERVLELNGCTLRIGPGDLIVFNPGDVHGCRQHGDGLFTFDSVTIASDRLDGAVLTSSKGAATEAKEAFESLLVVLDSDDGERALEHLLFLARLLEADEEDRSHDTTHETAVLRTNTYLLDHLAESESIERLAANEGISKYALIRAYRRRFAITPLQHLISLRVELACKLLAQGIEPVDAAVATGFSDQAHLTRMFKQRLGITPAAYRRMSAKNVRS